MTSQVFQIAQQVKATRQEMAVLAAKGWNWFVIAPSGRIHSKHRTESNTRHNINDHMRSQGFRVWSRKAEG